MHILIIIQYFLLQSLFSISIFSFNSDPLLCQLSAFFHSIFPTSIPPSLPPSDLPASSTKQGLRIWISGWVYNWLYNWESRWWLTLISPISIALLCAILYLTWLVMKYIYQTLITAARMYAFTSDSRDKDIIVLTSMEDMEDMGDKADEHTATKDTAISIEKETMKDIAMKPTRQSLEPSSSLPSTVNIVIPPPMPSSETAGSATPGLIFLLLSCLLIALYPTLLFLSLSVFSCIELIPSDGTPHFSPHSIILHVYMYISILIYESLKLNCKTPPTS